MSTLPKFNIAPEKLPKPNRKGSSSNHFSGAMLNFGGVGKHVFKSTEFHLVSPHPQNLHPLFAERQKVVDELVPFMKIKGIQTFGAATWTNFSHTFFVEEVSVILEKKGALLNMT